MQTLDDSDKTRISEGIKMKTPIRGLNALASMLLMTPLVTSCAFHQQLPSNWTLPAPIQIGNCPDISGIYVSMGETIKNKTTIPLIYELFVTAKDRKQYPLARWQEVSHISIQQQGQDLLEIAAWKGKETLYSSTLSKESNDFICEEGWVKVETSYLQGYSSSAAGFNSVSRNFSVSGGYLLEKRESNSIIMFSILPVIGSSVEWFRFAQNRKSE